MGVLNEKRFKINYKKIDFNFIKYEYITYSNMYKLINWIDIDKINWVILSSNPNAIQLLEQNIDKISWYMLSSNPNAIHLLEQHQYDIEWTYLSANPSIFELDYIKMAESRTKLILEDLIKNALHPNRLDRYIKLGGNIEDF